jgi:hypothetical protein
MHDMNPEKNKIEQGLVTICDPPNWISTEQLDAELFNANIEESKGFTGDEDLDLVEIDEYFDEEDNEGEAEQRRSTLRLLSLMRPQLVELLGAPAAE